MPSITTHHIFAEDVLLQLPLHIKNKIEQSKNIYTTFAQSHDYLYYYTFHKNAKKIKDLGNYAHKHKTQEYLLNIIQTIKSKKLENNSDALSYLYGSLTHYVLDTTCHPFIFYKTGACNDDDPTTYKYRGGHTYMEKSLDAFCYQQKYNKTYNHCNIPKDIIKKTNFTPELKELINTVYEKTYQEKNIATYYIKGIQDAKIIHNLIINDYTGLKRNILKTIETFSPNKHKYISFYSTHILKPNKQLLNLEHKTWNNPCNKNLTYTTSFLDLYQESIHKTINIIKQINKVLYEKQNIETLKTYIPDLSYSNGLPIKEYTPMKYFEF